MLLHHGLTVGRGHVELLIRYVRPVLGNPLPEIIKQPANLAAGGMKHFKGHRFHSSQYTTRGNQYQNPSRTGLVTASVVGKKALLRVIQRLGRN